MEAFQTFDEAVSTEAHKPRLANGATAGSLVHATPFAWTDPQSIPRRQWLYGHHYCRQFVSVTVAPGGMGKSSLTITEGLAMATGRPLLGETVHQPCRVWLWNGEDPMEEMQRRVIAACRHFAISPSDIDGRLFVDSGLDMPIVVVRETRDGATIATPVVEAIMDTIVANRIDVFVADPFVLTHQVNENSNAAIDAAGRQWTKIAEKTDIAVGLNHHVRKGAAGQGEFTVEDGRGASALIAVSRSARVLNRMTEDQGRSADVENHRRYFKVDNGKANLAPPADESLWRQLISHSLPNGDSVGVVAEWKWPDALKGMTVHDLIEVQKTINGKNYRMNVQANDWVGRPIAELLELDPDSKPDRERLKSMINVWMKSGALKVAQAKDGKGNLRPIVEVGQWANA